MPLVLKTLLKNILARAKPVHQTSRPSHSTLHLWKRGLPLAHSRSSGKACSMNTSIYLVTGLFTTSLRVPHSPWGPGKGQASLGTRNSTPRANICPDTQTTPPTKRLRYGHDNSTPALADVCLRGVPLPSGPQPSPSSPQTQGSKDRPFASSFELKSKCVLLGD